MSGVAEAVKLFGEGCACSPAILSVYGPALGLVICRELLGCDISTPDGMKRARDQDLFRTICPKLVQDAAEILEQMMSGSQPCRAAGRG